MKVRLLQVCTGVFGLVCTFGAVFAQPTQPLGRDDARHLLNRTSFAASAAEIESFAALTRGAAVDQLIAAKRTTAATPAPEWAKTYERLYRPQMTQEERQAATRRELVVRGLEMRTWWMHEMITTPSPLTEKMTLLWHNHFATVADKVRPAILMFRQNEILRTHALGNFGTLLREVSKDPAMLVFLDQAQSRKGAPNENFAREVMELFTLGEGHYTERDIKEAARALTGWSVDVDTGEFRFRTGMHDTGSKTILGKTGNFGGDDVLGLLLAHEATARFIVRKLWLEFISPKPDEQQVAHFAQVFRAENYEIAPLLRAMLASDAFYAPESRASLIKSPVDLIVGTLRQFKFEVHDAAPFAVLSRQLGQDLFQPPNVRGWPGGEVWVNTNSLLARKSFLNRVFRENEMGGSMEASTMSTANIKPAAFDAETAMADAGRNRQMARAAMRPEQRGVLQGQFFFDTRRFLNDFTDETSSTAKLQHTVLAGTPVQAEMSERSLAGIRSLVLDPIYQLK